MVDISQFVSKPKSKIPQEILDELRADRAVSKGDKPGHAFRGNQYTRGRGEDKEPKTKDGLPADFAERSGKKSPIGDAGSPAQTKKKIDDRLDDEVAYPHIEESAKVYRMMLEGRHVCLNMPMDCFEQLLFGDQRFKSQFESGSSKGMFDPDLRSRAESWMFGYGACEPTMRPIYGFLLKNPDEPSPSTDSYGDVKVVFKDDIKDRTTASFGDSLHWQQEQDPIPCRLDETDPRRLAAADSTQNIALLDPDSMSPQKAVDWETGYWASYTEAQIHGGVSLKDVDHLVLTAGTVDPDTARALRKAGIRYEVQYP